MPRVWGGPPSLLLIAALLESNWWIEDCLPQVRKAASPEAKVRLTKRAGTYSPLSFPPMHNPYMY